MRLTGYPETVNRLPASHRGEYPYETSACFCCCRCCATGRSFIRSVRVGLPRGWCRLQRLRTRPLLCAGCQDHSAPHMRAAEPDSDLHDRVVPAGDAEASLSFRGSRLKENQGNIICDACHPPSACDVRRRSVQTAAAAGSREPLHHEQIHRSNALRMIKDKRLPALRRRPPPPRHVFGYAGLAYIDPDLEQLTMDPRGSP